MSNLLRSLIVRVGADLSDFDKGMKTLSKNLKSTGKELTSTGENLTKALTLPIAAAATASIKYASDLEQNLGKTQATFKSSAGDIEAWSKTMLNSFGVAQSSALDMAALFGDMGTSMGLSTSNAATMSKQLVELSSDLASFKNIGLDQASTALKGIFTGEGEALKTLGVVMQESTLEAYALAQGFSKTYKEMEQGEKVQLRYQYVMDATKNAHGDFARTADTTANQMRITAESAKEAAAALGQNLLPMITPVITKLNEGIQAFAGMDSNTKQMIITFGLMAAGVGPATVGLGKMSSAASGVISNLGKASKAIQGGGGIVGAITAMIGPAGVAVAAIGAVAAATAAIAYVSTTTAESVRKSVDKQIEAYRKLEEQSIQSLEARYDTRFKLAENALTEESKLHEQNLKDLQATYLAEVDAAEKKNRAVIKGLEKEKSVLADAYNNRIQKIQEEYGVVSAAAKSRSDIVIEKYEAEADAAQSRYDEAVEAAEKAYDAEAKAAQDTYDQLIKANKDRLEVEKKAIKKRYDDSVKATTEWHDKIVSEAKATYDKEVDTAKSAYDERVKAAKTSYDAEVEGAKQAHKEKIALLDAELKRSQNAIDRQSSLVVGEMEDRIALLDGATAEEVAKERKKRREQRAIELEGLIAAERDEEEKAKLTQERASLVNQIIATSTNTQLEMQRWAIREEILSEKQKAADLKAQEEAEYKNKVNEAQAQLDEQINTLTAHYEEQTALYKSTLDNQLAALKESLDEQIATSNEVADIIKESWKTHYDNQLLDYQTSLEAENTAHKEALDDRIAELDANLATQKTVLDKNLAEQLAAIEVKKDAEIAIIQAEREAKEAAETAKYEAAQESLDKQIEAQETALDDTKEVLKKDYEEYVKEAEDKTAKNRQGLNNRLEDLKTNLEEERKAIQEEAEKRIKQAEENAKLFKNSILGQAVLGDRDMTVDAPSPGYSNTYGGNANNFMPKNMPALPSGLGQNKDLKDYYVPIPGLKDPSLIIPSYDVGTNYVPRDGLAYLHQGEAVVPAAYNNGNGMIREAEITINNHNYTPEAARASADEFGRVLRSRGIGGGFR